MVEAGRPEQVRLPVPLLCQRATVPRSDCTALIVLDQFNMTKTIKNTAPVIASQFPSLIKGVIRLVIPATQDVMAMPMHPATRLVRNLLRRTPTVISSSLVRAGFDAFGLVVCVGATPVHLYCRAPQ